MKKNNNIIYAYCDGYVTDKNLNVIYDSYNITRNALDTKKRFFEVINGLGFPLGHTTAFKSSFARKILPSKFTYDEWFALCAFADGNVYQCKEKLIYFRRHSESFSGATGGGKKQNALTRIKDKSFNEYFAWPELRAKGYERLLELYKNDMDIDIINNLTDRIDFGYKLNQIKDKKLFFRIRKLIGYYRTSQYKKYRGNRNTFILDLIYIVFYLQPTIAICE